MSRERKDRKKTYRCPECPFTNGNRQGMCEHIFTLHLQNHYRTVLHTQPITMVPFGRKCWCGEVFFYGQDTGGKPLQPYGKSLFTHIRDRYKKYPQERMSFQESLDLHYTDCMMGIANVV